MRTAKLFTNGNSQAVRLPQEFRFEGDVVFIQKNHRGDVVLTSKPRTWAEYFSKYASDLPIDGFMEDRENTPTRDRDLF